MPMTQTIKRDKGGCTTVFDRLKGRWRLERDISSPAARVTGEAVFTRENSAPLFRYREEGMLTLLPNGAQTPVYRTYIYKMENGGIAVYFADGPHAGQIFQHLRMENDLTATAHHRCIADDYNSLYQFDREGFTITHHVKGPQKDYISTSQFTREPFYIQTLEIK